MPKRKPSDPVTPIPPRASAQRTPYNVKVRPKYVRTHMQSTQVDSDIAHMPTLPPPSMWQYESPDFEIESSLPSLSLLVDVPTHPEPPLSPRSTDRLSDIYEIDTIPDKQIAKQIAKQSAEHHTEIDQIDTIPSRLLSGHHSDIDKIDTLPPVAGARVSVAANQTPALALIPAPPALPSARSGIDQLESRRSKLHDDLTDPSSWTAGGASGSPYAQRIADRAKGRKQEPSFNPLDHVRWWLLRPGRIEFLFWLGGTLLLLGVTFVLLLVTAISFAWFTPVSQNGIASSPNGAGNYAGGMPTVITTPGVLLSLVDKGPLLAGLPFHLRGKGFTPHGTVEFIDEKMQPLFSQDGQSSGVQADAQGVFTVTLNDTTWVVGMHLVIARDMATGHRADILITLAPGPFGKNATATPTNALAGVTATTAPGGGPVNYPTAVNSTPGLPTPTVSITPTPSPTPTQQPSPTPTPGVTPTATPGITPTATVGITPTVNSSSSPTPSATNSMAPSAAASVGSIDPPPLSSNLLGSWAWLLMLGYGLSMLMLGIAGVIRKRR